MTPPGTASTSESLSNGAPLPPNPCGPTAYQSPSMTVPPLHSSIRPASLAAPSSTINPWTADTAPPKPLPAVPKALQKRGALWTRTGVMLLVVGVVLGSDPPFQLWILLCRRGSISWQRPIPPYHPTHDPASAVPKTKRHCHPQHASSEIAQTLNERCYPDPLVCVGCGC